MKLARVLALGLLLAVGARTSAQVDPLPSWNDGAARQAILSFVKETTDVASPRFVPPAERMATFDQDGTLWVSHPVYTQVMFCLERVPAVVKAKPELARVEPFKTVLRSLGGDPPGMSVEDFQADVRRWLETARDPRWKRPYTELTYLPMQEVLKYLRGSGYRTFIFTGGGQDFVRVYSEETYGIPPEQVVGSALGTTYGYAKDGKPFLTREPKLLLDDNDAGKPEGIHLVIGRRPRAAFGNSTGDRQMLEYTQAGEGARLSMLVLHDDARREYAYGPAQGLPDTKVGAFSAGTVRPGEPAGLGGRPHEGRLEEDLRLRALG